MIDSAIVAISSASRSRMDAATASPPVAASKTTGESRSKPRRGDPPVLDRHRHVDRSTEPEVRRDERLQDRPRTAAVAGPDRGAQGGHPEVAAAAPVARDVAQGGEACRPPVWGDARGVDPGPADDADAPAPFRAGPNGCERVVEDERVPATPAAASEPVSRRTSAGVSAPASV